MNFPHTHTHTTDKQLTVHTKNIETESKNHKILWNIPKLSWLAFLETCIPCPSLILSSLGTYCSILFYNIKKKFPWLQNIFKQHSIKGTRITQWLEITIIIIIVVKNTHHKYLLSDCNTFQQQNIFFVLKILEKLLDGQNDKIKIRLYNRDSDCHCYTIVVIVRRNKYNE